MSDELKPDEFWVVEKKDGTLWSYPEIPSCVPRLFYSQHCAQNTASYLFSGARVRKARVTVEVIE